MVLRYSCFGDDLNACRSFLNIPFASHKVRVSYCLLSLCIFYKEWQPFPPNHPSCGPDYITGVGGEITSPGYPKVYEPDVECTWMLRVEDDMFILLNFIDLDLGQSGRLISRQYRNCCLNFSNEY